MFAQGVIKKFSEPITLKSGKKSNIYINWREISNSVSLLEKLAYTVIQNINEKFPECTCIYGVPEGATKLALICQFLRAKSRDSASSNTDHLAMGRAKPKLHGDPADKYFIGVPKGKVVVIEDVITSGQSLFKCLDDLKRNQIDVIGTLVLTDRSEVINIREELNQRNITLHSLTEIEQIKNYLEN